MLMPFRQICIGELFRYQSKLWQKTGNDRACIYDVDARQCIGEPFRISGGEMVQTL